MFFVINKDNTWYSKRKEELRMRIQEIYDENNQILGAGKIAAIMRNEGAKVSEEMVRTLMRDMGIGSIRQVAKKLYEKSENTKIISIKNSVRIHRMRFG